MNPRTFYTIAGLVVFSIAGGIYFFPRQDHPTAVQPEPMAMPAVNTAGLDGAKLYDEHCDKCHGLTERTYGPALTSLSSTSEESLRTLILKGVPETDMKSFADELSTQQVAAIVKYLREEALPKSAADKKRLEIGPNAAKTQIGLQLVQVSGGDLVVRATLKDDKGAAMVKNKVVINQVSLLGGRLPLAMVETNEQGLAIYYYPIKPGESVRIEAAYEGERGRAASSAMDEASLPGGKEPESLTQGLLSASPPFGLVVIIGVVVGSIWLTFGYIVSLLLQIASWKDSTSRLLQKQKS
jgi:mono/diheme cytochrome c family protein